MAGMVPVLFDFFIVKFYSIINVSAACIGGSFGLDRTLTKFVPSVMFL